MIQRNELYQAILLMLIISIIIILIIYESNRIIKNIRFKRILVIIEVFLLIIALFYFAGYSFLYYKNREESLNNIYNCKIYINEIVNAELKYILNNRIYTNNIELLSLPTNLVKNQKCNKINIIITKHSLNIEAKPNGYYMNKCIIRSIIYSGVKSNVMLIGNCK